MGAAIRPGGGGGRHAVIDVGTNSVKLLVGEVRPEGVHPVWEDSEQTRLGRGLYESGCLQPDAVARTVQAVGRMASVAREHGAECVRVFATSAAREAPNADDLRSAVQGEVGLVLEVVSGEREAWWGYLGVASDPQLGGGRLVVVDAGGGSTEVVVGAEGRVLLRESLPLGCVRLLERHPVGDPPSAEDWEGCGAAIRDGLAGGVGRRLDEWLSETTDRGYRLVGASGTATILAKLKRGVTGWDREALEGVRWSRSELAGFRERLWGMTLAERRGLKGMPPERADVMLVGVAIYEVLMARLGMAELRISLRNLRYGALLEIGGDPGERVQADGA
jgi:exopolyphosphatase / guanosine-5'-triphosphate,3'-diphosphate pyrophosphatase